MGIVTPISVTFITARLDYKILVGRKVALMSSVPVKRGEKGIKRYTIRVNSIQANTNVFYLLFEYFVLFFTVIFFLK